MNDNFHINHNNYFSSKLFQYDMSGIDTKELHPKNMFLIYFIFAVFHLDTSGNDINELHPENI